MGDVIYLFDEFELDAERSELRHGGQIVDAEAMAIRLLACLVAHQGSVVTKDELIDAVWEGRALADNAITVCMARLRKVLRRYAGDRNFVATVYGQGYRFVHPVQQSDRPARSRPAPPFLGERESNPCVGREDALTRLWRMHQGAGERRGAVCAVMGTAGVGKTRLVEAFETRLPADHRMVWAYCRESGTAPPLSPWQRLLQTLLVNGLSDTLTGALGPHAEPLRAWLGLSAVALPKPLLERRDAAGRAIFEAILRTLTILAEEQPLCLVLDDLHRADAASLELLYLLLDEVAHTRILVLCTVRQGEGTPVRRSETYLPAILGHRNCERLPLSPLERDAVATFVHARLGEVSPALVDAILVGSDGIPFFMLELVRQVELHGPLSPSSLASNLTVPAAALELFRSRVASLSEAAQHVLRIASVVGRTFELCLLHDTSDLSPTDVLLGIDEAIAFDIVVAAPGSVSAFAFEHELMRRAVYETIPVAQRRSLHLRIATAMEQRGIVSDELTHMLAYQLHAALPEGDLDKTTHYCQLAAHAAAAAFANPDAASHLQRALEALSFKPDASPKLRAHMHLFKAMYSRGQVGYRESLEAVRHLGVQVGDASLLAQAAFMYNPHPAFKPTADARTVLEYALTIAPQSDGTTRARLLGCLAASAPGCFDRATTEARMAEAQALADKPENQAAQYAVGLARLHLLGGPRYGEQRRETRDALGGLARAYPELLPILPIDLAIDDALHAMQRGAPREADAALMRAARLSRAVNHRELQWHVQRMRAWSSLNRAEPGQAVSELAQLHRRAARNEVIDLGFFCAFDRCMLALDGLIAPNLDDADLLALARDPADPVHVWAMKVRALAAIGLTTEARDLLHTVSPARIANLPSDAQSPGSLAQLGKAAIALDEADHAAAVMMALSEHPEGFAINIGYRCEGAIAQVQGELAAHLGDREQARALLARAVEQSERVGLARCAAEARLAFSELAAAS